MSREDAPLSEVAFYYPGHLWRNPEWIKSLLLFFDGIGLLVPEYKQHEPESMDPVLAGPLRDKGILHYLVADRIVDKEATKSLAIAIGDLLSAGVFEPLRQRTTVFHNISLSRMGYYGDERIFNQIFNALRKRGLAADSTDGVSVPVHPLVRYLILTLLAQIVRSKAAGLGLDLSPATDNFIVVRALTELLNLPTLPSTGHVVAFDLQNVSVDVSSIPLDEIFAFRDQHLSEHREYVRSIRRFARELSLMPAGDRVRAFNDRQSELDDLASDLRRKSRSAWRRPASFCLGLAGGCWTLATGNPVGAIFGLGGLLVRGLERSSVEAGAYSYLFAAHERFAE